METTRICPSCQKPLPPDVPLGLCPECLIKSGFNTGTEPGNPGKESGFVPPPVEELRKLFPQLEILELIGKGGMGAVYKARQMALDRLVALKILPPGAADDAGFAERFNREARALARLNHPHIVAVHDFGQAGGQPYLVMEFVDGPNLRQVEQAGRLTPEQALEIVPQICEALQFAHNEGVVHRDIKPENILLDKKGRVKITDFGIAKIVGVPAGKISLTGAKDVLGTPHYMAPEQVEKPSTVDHRADIYSLGVVFYELLTGELPLGKFQPPSKKVQVDVRLDEVVLHTLEKEPERRYQQASQVKTDVEKITATAAKSEARSLESEVEARLEFLERRRRNMLLYGFWASVMGLPITLALRMPYLSLLAVAGIFIGGFKLGWFTREGWQQFRLSLAKKGLGRTVMVEDTASRWAQVACFVAALLVLVLGMRELSQFDLRPHELFFGVLLVLVLTLVMVVAGLLIGSVPASRRGPTTPAAPAGRRAGSVPAAVQQAVRAPAGWLVATGILNWIAIPLIIFVTMGIVAGKTGSVSAFPILVIPLSAMLLSSVMIVAGLKMKRLEAYPLAIIGSILAILVMPGNIIGLPVGIWSLVVLCRREVREAFGRKLSPDLHAMGAASVHPVPRPDRFWRRFAVAAALVVLAMILIPVGLIVLSITLPAFHKARERARIVQGEVVSAVPITPPMSVSFSPVHEVILNDLDESRGNEALSLGRGQLLSLPADFGKRKTEERENWLSSNRVDLLVDYARDRWALLSRGMQFRDLREPDLGWGGVWPESEVLEKREGRGGTFYLLPTNAPLPLNFAILTASGDQGVLQITGLFTNEPRGMKLRYKLTQLSGGGGGGATTATQSPQRKFARLVADKSALTFEGQPTNWDGVDTLLSKMPDRKNTVLEFAVTSDQITVAQQNEWFQKASALARQHGFEYASFIGIHPLGSKGSSSSSARSVPPFAQAKPGEYRVELTNGVMAEVLALTSTPRAAMAWWQPDGTLLAEAPGDRLGEFPKLCPGGKSAVEFAVVIGGSGEIAQEQERVLVFDPQPQYVALAFSMADGLMDSAPVVGFRTRPGGSTSRFGLAVVGFRTAPESLTCRIGLAEGEWQRVATWDAAGTLLSNETGGPLQLVRSGDEHTTCAKLAHRVDPNRFAVRLAARLKDGQHRIARVCRTDYGGTEEARICALIEEMQDADVVAYELYRVPLRWAAIPAIATKPTVPPLQVAPGTSSQQSPATTFGPVMTRSVSGEGDARRRFIDFETGRQFAASEFFGPKAEPSPEETQKWWKDNSIDAMGDTSPAVLGLVGLDMVAVPVPLHEWDMIPARLDYYLAAAKPGTPVTMSAKGDLPATYVIQTREGGRGLLQITGFSGATPDTRSVMIRYKLVQSLNKSNRLSRLLSDPERSRALALFNDIEDFGHEFEAAFASTNLAAAETGVRRLLSLLTNFNTTVNGTDYQFPPALLEDIAKVRHALQEGDWSEARLLARHNEEYAREFRRIGGEMADLARELNAMQSPPTNQVTARKLAAEKVAVEDLALRMLAAIRDKEDDVLQSLAVDRIKGWRASLPHFAFEARERFQQMRGRPFNLLPTESLVEGDYAVVKCDDPKAANQIYLVLQFVRTEHGWKNWSLRNSPPATPLAEHLKQLPPGSSAGAAKPNH